MSEVKRSNTEQTTAKERESTGQRARQGKKGETKEHHQKQRRREHRASQTNINRARQGRHPICFNVRYGFAQQGINLERAKPKQVNSNSTTTGHQKASQAPELVFGAVRVCTIERGERAKEIVRDHPHQPEPRRPIGQGHGTSAKWGGEPGRKKESIGS